MDPKDEKTTTDEEPKAVPQAAPADALSRTPDDLADEQAVAKAEEEAKKPPVKKVSAVRRFFRKMNVYFLLFLLTLVIAGAIVAVYYLNSQKEPVVPTIGSQELSEDALKQLANKDASVGDSSQTLTIQGNAIINGQTLMRGNLNVAGNLQTGGSLQAPSLTISGKTTLGETQINSLQIASNTAIQGDTSLRNLTVAGSSNFSGAMKASQITASRLILSGNASLEIPNHISFTGPSPSRSITSSVLGSGGSASVNGSDTTGTININTGNNPQAGCFARISFNQAFTNPPHVIISPVGNAAGRTQHYVDRDKTGFSICTANAAPANQAFAFDYFVTN
jgi:cytoskeletal protein CcmA (bactofilin family)